MQVRFITTHGPFDVELDAERAPVTVENFLAYVRDGFYDGTIFHRVIPNFMVQGGGLEPGMRNKPTRESIQNESGNGLSNVTGTLAMARTSAPHSATAQFFINVVDNHFLDKESPHSDGWGYCVFGRVSAGMEVIEAIRRVPTGNRGGHQDVPVEDVLIESATVIGETPEAS
jgi:peptidyl-prolyl cis-trans isomerase B (cyclophilin B)